MTDEQISIFTLASDGLPDGTALWQFYSAKMQKILLYFLVGKYKKGIQISGREMCLG
jgi:hypothetical protein